MVALLAVILERLFPIRLRLFADIMEDGRQAEIYCSFCAKPYKAFIH
jgi:redox-regulated HSP33 family molecular chaperone